MATTRRSRIRRWLFGTALGVFVAVNVVAFLQAWAMTHFQTGSARTSSAESLSVWEKIKVLATGVRLPRPANRQTPSHFGMAFDTLTLPGARGTQLEAWRIRVANPRAVVLLFHGYGASKDSMLDLARELQALGCEPWLIDFHGSGGSTGHTTSLGWHEAEDVEAAFARARAESPRSRIICHGSSMGAAAVLRAVAVGRIQPDALILECPFNRMLDTVENRFHLMKLPAFPLAHFLVFWGGAQQGFNAFAHNPEEYARQVRCPVLLLQGEQDTRATLPQVQRIVGSLGTNCVLKTFPHLSHESYVAGAPEEWRRTVGDFLAKVVP